MAAVGTKGHSRQKETKEEIDQPTTGFNIFSDSRANQKNAEPKRSLPTYEHRMTTDIERNLGTQPIARILAENSIAARDLVVASTEHITHKMVARACKGRRLTPNVQSKIRNAVNRVAEREFSVADLFTY